MIRLEKKICIAADSSRVYKIQAYSKEDMVNEYGMIHTLFLYHQRVRAGIKCTKSIDCFLITFRNTKSKEVANTFLECTLGLFHLNQSLHKLRGFKPVLNCDLHALDPLPPIHIHITDCLEVLQNVILAIRVIILSD